MRAGLLNKVKILLGILSITLAFGSEAKAYEPYTWSELVTGPKSKLAQEEDSLYVVSEWCGLKRIVKGKETNTVKMRKAKTILGNTSKYAHDEIYKAVMDMRYIYLYSLKDAVKADEVLTHLDSIPALKDKAEVERLFASMSETSLLQDSFYKRLKVLSGKEKLFPYDNGYMPVITANKVATMLAINEMLEGKGKERESLKCKTWKNIPATIIYNIAIDKREIAYKEYKAIEKDLDPGVKSIIDDFLYPLYMPVPTANRKFLAGLICVEEFPGLGMDLVNESLTYDPRITNAEHALACLSDVYAKHNAYGEAQKVLKILRDLYPNSLWLK